MIPCDGGCLRSTGQPGGTSKNAEGRGACGPCVDPVWSLVTGPLSLSIHCIDNGPRRVDSLPMSSRNHQLQIRVSESQKEAIRTAARRAGVGMSEWVLARLFPEPAERLTALARRADADGSPAAWAEIIELLQRRTRVDFQAAVRDLQVEGLSRFTANYLAALVEETADRLGELPPPWTARVAPLPSPWFGTELRRVREHLLLSAPVAFRRRNLFVDAGVGDRV